MVVGAPFSDATFYFRSRPVVRVDGSIRMETGANGIVDPDFRNCTLTSNGVQVKTITDQKTLKKGNRQKPTGTAILLSYVVVYKELSRISRSCSTAFLAQRLGKSRGCKCCTKTIVNTVLHACHIIIACCI